MIQKADKAIINLLHDLSASAQRSGNTREADHYCDMILDLVRPEPRVIPVTMYFTGPTHYCKDGKIMPKDFQPGCY